VITSYVSWSEMHELRDDHPRRSLD
jgi:hypothetical protein